MDSDIVFKALNSNIRRNLLKILYNNPSTVDDIYKMKQKYDIEVKYRTSLYRSLEMLVKANLLEKKYIAGKGICYSTKINIIKYSIKEKIIKME